MQVPVWADSTLTPYAAEDVEHSSNVFDLPSSSPDPLGKHGATKADTYFDTRAGVEAAYRVDEQRFFGTAEYRHFSYENFTALDHNETLFDAGLKYKFQSLLDGQFEYRREQRMVQFQDLTAATELVIETDSKANASINVNVTPEWRVENLAQEHVLNSPRIDVPGLSLHEDSITEGLKYIGVANLSAGLQAVYLRGRYDHDPLALDPQYSQYNIGLAGTYIVSGLTSFAGSLGYTRREDPTNQGNSGLTGNIVYQHRVSGKTTLNLQLSRVLSTYVTTGGNEIDSTIGTSINYQATYKILVRAGYAYTKSQYPETPAGTVEVNRLDHFQTANVDVTYQVLHWLSVRPYVRYQTRHSNLEVYSFDNSMVGIEILAKRPVVDRR